MGELSRFREELRACLPRRGDALFELVDAMLCTSGPVRSPVELSLEPEFNRRHSSVYDALHHGRLDTDRLRLHLVARTAPARDGEPLMFAIDCTPLARPDARYADQRTMVMVRGKGPDVFLPGWNFSVLVGVGWGASSWVQPLEARRLRPTEHHTEIACAQIRSLTADLRASGRWSPGDPHPLIILDAGNQGTDLAAELGDLPVQLLVRLRSDRIFYGDPPARIAGTGGRPRRHGQQFSCADPARRPAPDAEHTVESDRYGTVTVRSWNNLHQALSRQGWWSDYPLGKDLPIVRGTVIQVVVERLPHSRTSAKDLWLWHAGVSTADPDLLWKAYLRRFDQEHFHRFAKVHLGMTAAHLGSAEAVDRWTALIIAAYTQLWLARHLVDDLRRPWHPRPASGTTLSPYRVRLGFRRLRAKLPEITQPPKPRRPGPGRPKGSRNKPKATRPAYRSSPLASKEHKA
ncbi:NF041680 family putative transposase [Streptomyces sp. NPDC005349]|uniref:NF041680 family putative transposase n=1 Tax=Streptomyces sp. NPDC005349 TaxID=3157037 RepID=UPI0033AFB9E0